MEGTCGVRGFGLEDLLFTSFCPATTSTQPSVLLESRVIGKPGRIPSPLHRGPGLPRVQQLWAYHVPPAWNANGQRA